MGNGVVRGGRSERLVAPVGRFEDGGNGLPVRSNGSVEDGKDWSTSGKTAGTADAPRSTLEGLEISDMTSNPSHSLKRMGKKKPLDEDSHVGRVKEEEDASERLEEMLKIFRDGNLPPVEDLKRTLSMAAQILQRNRSQLSIEQSEECLEAVHDTEVREWLSTTFTHSDSIPESRERPRTPLLMFKAAANSIIISKFMKNITGSSSCQDIAMPTEVITYMESKLGRWDFDVFHLKALSSNSPLRCVAYQLFKSHDLFDKFQIPLNVFDLFMVKIETGYNCHSNPYHNSAHGADVAQTLNFLFINSGILELMSDVEVMAALLAALIHDVDHPGKSNQFLVQQQCEWALLYHDKSVLENHHLKVTFDLLHEEPTNFLVSLTVEDYRSLRGIVIDMVLATDMAQHFNVVKSLAAILSSPEGGVQLLEKDRHKVFESVLHLADISHPGKPWQLHHEWSLRVCEEFYRQGDEEKDRGIPVSPLCDRGNSNLATSQIKFAEIIVAPLFKVGGDMIELVLKTGKEKGLIEDVVAYPRVWDTCLQENMKMWNERQQKEESFRQPAVLSKAQLSPVLRKKSLSHIRSNHFRDVQFQRKISLDVLMPRTRGRGSSQFSSADQRLRVPKITLEPIDSSDLDNSRGSTPNSSFSAYDSCSEGTDAVPETPNSLGGSSDFLSSGSDSPLLEANVEQVQDQDQLTGQLEEDAGGEELEQHATCNGSCHCSSHTRDKSRSKAQRGKLCPRSARNEGKGRIRRVGAVHGPPG